MNSQFFNHTLINKSQWDKILRFNINTNQLLKYEVITNLLQLGQLNG